MQIYYKIIQTVQIKAQENVWYLL